MAETPHPTEESHTSSTEQLLAVVQPAAVGQAGQELYNLYPDLLGLLDSTGKLIRLNPAFERLTGYTEADVIGQSLGAYLHPDEREGILAVLRSPNQGGLVQHRLARLRAADDRYLWVAWSFLPGLEPDRTFVVGRDVNAYKQAEITLLERERQLERTLDIAGLATWELDLVTLEFTFDDRLLALLQVPAEDEPEGRIPFPRFLERYAEPASATQLFQAILRMARSTAGDYHEHVACTLRTTAGELLSVELQMRGLAGADSTIARAFGTVGIAKKSETPAATAVASGVSPATAVVSETAPQQSFDALPLPILILSSELTIRSANELFYLSTLWDAPSLAGKPLDKVLSLASGEPLELPFAHSKQDEATQVLLRTATGTQLPAGIRASRSGDGWIVLLTPQPAPPLPQPDPEVESLQQELQRLKAAAELVTLVVDWPAQTLHHTSALNTWLGLSPDTDLTWDAFATDHLAFARATALGQALASVAEGNFDTRVLEFGLKDVLGNEREVRCALARVPDEPGIVEVVLQDISYVRAEQQQSQTSLQQLAELWSHTGLARLELASDDVLTCDEYLMQWLGAGEEAPTGAQIPLEAFYFNCVALESREQLMTALATLKTSRQGATKDFDLTLSDAEGAPVETHITLWKPQALGAGGAEVVGILQKLPPAPVPTLEQPEETPAPQAALRWNLSLAAAMRAAEGDISQALTALTTLAQDTLGLTRVSLWLLHPDAESCYRIAPQSDPLELAGEDTVPFFTALGSGQDIGTFDTTTTEALQAIQANPAFAPAPAWVALPVARGGTLIGFLLAESDSEQELADAIWPLHTLAAHAVALLDADAIRDSAEQAGQLQIKAEELQHNYLETQQMLIRVRQGTDALGEAFLKEQGQVAVGRLAGHAAEEMSLPLGNIQLAARNLERSLMAVLNEVPTVLKVLTEQEKELFQALADTALKRRRELTTQEERTARAQLEVELLQLGVPKPEDMAKELVEAGLNEGAGRFIPILRHTYAELVLDKIYKLVALRRNLQAIDKASLQASSVLDTLLKLRGADEANTEIEVIDLAESLEGVLGLYGYRFYQGVRLEREYTEKPRVQAIAGKLFLLLLRLMEQALNELPSDGLLRVSLREEDGWARLGITDTGKGLPPDWQLEPDGTLDLGRAGSEAFPLLHAQQLALQLGGRLEVWSEPGRKRVTAILPIA